MLPIGYMYKQIVGNPDWLKNDRVEQIYSVSDCVSEDFDDWINYWAHNGYWFFDSPDVIRDVARENNIDLSEMKLFFYEAHDLEWDDDLKEWQSYEPEASVPTNVIRPMHSTLEGYDVVTFYVRTSAEHSPLSCNGLAEDIKVNNRCLLDSFDEGKTLLETGAFTDSEPGPYRIFAVYSVEDA